MLPCALVLFPDCFQLGLRSFVSPMEMAAMSA
jgi:hypothetical protein